MTIRNLFRRGSTTVTPGVPNQPPPGGMDTGASQNRRSTTGGARGSFTSTVRRVANAFGRRTQRTSVDNKYPRPVEPPRDHKAGVLAELDHFIIPALARIVMQYEEGPPTLQPTAVPVKDLNRSGAKPVAIENLNKWINQHVYIANGDGDGALSNGHLCVVRGIRPTINLQMPVETVKALGLEDYATPSLAGHGMNVCLDKLSKRVFLAPTASDISGIFASLKSGVWLRLKDGAGPLAFDRKEGQDWILHAPPDVKLGKGFPEGHPVHSPYVPPGSNPQWIEFRIPRPLQTRLVSDTYFWQPRGIRSSEPKPTPKDGGN